MSFGNRHQCPRRMIPLFILIVCSLRLGAAFPQSTQRPHGEFVNRKIGVMDGNFIRTIFKNHGEIADWPNQPSGEWPKGSGHSYLDGAAPYVIAEVIDSFGNVVTPLESQYREDMDVGPTGQRWGFEPLPGFANPDQDLPALSNDPNTWPSVWPDKLGEQDDPGWPGAWNGFFGKNQFNADLETYFWADDFQDREFRFTPDPSEPERGGLGMLMKVRGLQWSSVLAEDVLFWLYDMTNISPNLYSKVIFGMFFDAGVGGTGDSSDDNGLFDTTLDITFAFDSDNIGDTGWGPVGTIGFAFLESPSNEFDGLDNDADGLIDESRSSGPGELIFGPIGIFGDPKLHWSGDEDGDWRSFDDLNGDGEWDPDTEALFDDVGADGISNLDPNYPGPDQGEGDGIPTAGEPNFDQTDLDEGDQIGLTAVDVITLHTMQFKDDELVWQRMQPGNFDTELQPNTNLGLWYGSGLFPMPPGQTERFSIALVMGEDRDDLLRNKETVQQIFNADYRFARPPSLPRLKAVAGDKKVTLYWDRSAEDSVDPFLNFKKDFEGYAIYRATDPAFLEVRTITDAFGVATFRKPIAKFDLIDGITGPDPVGFSGASFDRGSDTGLRHTWVDSTVENGQTYFYAVTAYDQGDPDFGSAGLAVIETTTIIRIDQSGQVVSTDLNTAAVTPNAPAAGYNPARIDEPLAPVGTPAGTGTISLQIVDPALVKDDTFYEVVFQDNGVNETVSYSVINMTVSPPETLLSRNKFFGRDPFGFLREGDVFDGLSLFIDNDPDIVFVDSLSGWVEGDSNFEAMIVGALFRTYAADYKIEFFDEVVDTSISPIVPVKFKVTNVTEGRKAKFRFRDSNRDGLWSSGEFISIREEFNGQLQEVWRITLKDTTSGIESRPPSPGDVIFIATTKPFRQGDVFQFKTKAAFVDRQEARRTLDRIKVVPNPYVSAVSWERKNLFQTSRGERRIDFIHLPTEATIRIYNVKGELVDTIEHQSTIDDGAASWDLRSKEGLSVAFGIYYFHVKSPEGEFLGKFALIK
ncbi:hypothetical protein IID10_22220 [candidate division KSB1 bacterium]|nr:hypothetical protein [candidate division KSB1 bacterium]